MKQYELQYSKEASKELLRLDGTVARRIVKKIGLYSTSDNPLTYAKQLSGNFSGLYRYRIGDYRVIFEVSEKGLITVLTVLTIKHRKDVYRSGI